MLAAVLGSPISHSLSPVLHNAAYRELGLPHEYSAIEVTVEQFPRFMATVNSFWLGVSLTMPLKEAVIPLLDEVSAEAREIGAVNTVVIDARGRTSGHNTDRSGFRAAFREQLGAASVAGKAVLQLGAGGAGRAVSFALMDLGAAEIMLYDTDRAKEIGRASCRERV